MTESEPAFVSARDVLANSWRPDLVSKYLLARSFASERRDLRFLWDIYDKVNFHLNFFYESEPTKYGPADFRKHFLANFDSIKNFGFIASKGSVQISGDQRLIGGAHRTAICAALGKDVPTTIERTGVFSDLGFTHMKSRGLHPQILDFLALENLKLDSNARCFVLHGVLDADTKAEKLSHIRKHLRVTHVSEVSLTEAGYLSLKYINYVLGGPDRNLLWAGSPSSGWHGLRDHASRSYGDGRVTLAIIRASDDEIAQVKRDQRLGLEHPNHSIHSSDSWAETFAIATSLLHPESLQALNNRHLGNLSPLDTFAQRLFRSGGVEDQVMAAMILGGSASMDAHGIRNCRDVDIIFGDVPKNILDDPQVSVRSAYESEGDSVDLELDPSKYLYFRGIKISGLVATRMFKIARGEVPKDSNDVDEINKYMRGARKTPVVEKSVSSSRIFLFISTILFILSQRFNYAYNIALRAAVCVYRLFGKLR